MVYRWCSAPPTNLTAAPSCPDVTGHVDDRPGRLRTCVAVIAQGQGALRAQL